MRTRALRAIGYAWAAPTTSSQPLHATFLIDARGNVRFQRISSDPFLDVDFIKAEAARVNRMLKTP